MTITQTVEVPDTRRLIIDVPREIPTGRTIIAFTPVPKETAPLHPCPICAKNIDPETGNPRYNAETIAAMEEGRAIMRGELPAKWYDNIDDMLADLKSDDKDGDDD